MEPVPNIFVSTGAFQFNTIDRILQACADEGIANVELSSGLQFEPGIVDRARRFHGRPLRFLIHNYFPPHEQPFVLNLGSTDDQTRARSVEHCRSAIELAAEFGAPFYSVHAGAAFEARVSDLGNPLAHTAAGDVDEAYSGFVSATRELARWAAARGLSLLIENHVVAPFNVVRGRRNFLFASSPAEIRRLVEDVGSPGLGILMDVGHLAVTAASFGFDRLKAIDEVAPYIKAFHLSDNDGTEDQNLPFDGGSWFVPLLRRFRDVIHVIESYRLPIAAIHECHDVVAKAIA
jgi:sugar phosphate isomerase/epimerase